MQVFYDAFLFHLVQLLIVLSCLLNSSSCSRRFDGFYAENYYDRQAKVKLALEKLENAPHWTPNWPDRSLKMGQVSGLALDNTGNLLVFHRASNVWDATTFSSRDVYQNIGEPPIPHATILVLNETGHLIDAWGQNLFHMPHGITVSSTGDVWVTDVAMHQVMKFTPQDRQKPALVLGEKFVPRDDDSHFCKPTAVAVLSSGDFFVADGYCNSRIIKYAPDGTKILQFGRRAGESPFVFAVPHALALAEERGLVCVADRERGRAACFRADNGTYHSAFRHAWLVGPRLFSLAYAPVHGGRLYVVNGPTVNGEVPVRGYVIDFTSGQLLQTFAPQGEFSNPHDVVVSPDGSRVYVAEINPYKVHRFVDDSLTNESSKGKVNVTAPVKPTATIEVPSGAASIVDGVGVGVGMGVGKGGSWWGGALGGAAGAGGAALAVLAALALLRARNHGRKSRPRRRWEYGGGEFQLRRLLERRARGAGTRGGGGGGGGRFTRVHSDDSDDEPTPMLPPHPPAPANA